MSYDDTTLFCPAGMQKYKKNFSDLEVKGNTICNSQSCIRLNDLDLIGDGTHFGSFEMLGLFSFRDWPIKKGIDFWIDFVREILGIKLTHVTIHPDRKEWEEFYPNLEVKLDENCKWSDGEIGGYCTEFFVGDLEIGNIVNPLGDCLDVGFGLERLDGLVNGFERKSRQILLSEAIMKIINSGIKPSNIKHGYILRKLLRTLLKEGGTLDHVFFEDEKTRQNKMISRYENLKLKNPSKSKEWWFDTHGIDLNL